MKAAAASSSSSGSPPTSFVTTTLSERVGRRGGPPASEARGDDLLAASAAGSCVTQSRVAHAEPARRREHENSKNSNAAASNRSNNEPRHHSSVVSDVAVIPAGSSSTSTCDRLVRPFARAPILLNGVALLLVALGSLSLQAAHCFTFGLGPSATRTSSVERQPPRGVSSLGQPQLGGGHQLTIGVGANSSLRAWQAAQARSLDGGGESKGAAGEEARAAHWALLPNRPSLFNIIRFPNEECFDSSNQSGTCYTAFECKLLGGQPSSPCAAGFGSCCIVSRTCHVTTREKVVYFKNPSYPSADSDEKFCDLTVEMSDLNVCQLRLDFLDFQLDPPTHGACRDDYLEISASGMPPQTIPRLCGMNRNQHLYINLPQDLSERSASIVFYTDPVGDHRWQVKVTQIDCNHYRPLDWKRHYAKFAASPLWNAHPNLAPQRLGGAAGGKYSTTFATGFQTMSQTASALAYELLRPQFTPRAPMGCLQYFNQPSGIIESFNFGQYLNNMDYSICIQRQPDTCRVVFTSSDYDWSLNGVGISGSSSGVGDQDCARDYLLIPGASRTGDGFTYDRYCGGRLHYYRGQALSAPLVMKTSGPIVLRFHSDAHFESVNNGGFRLQYDQSTQDCIYHTAEEAGSLASQQIIMSTLSDSRPLNPFPVEAPVLYASQQLAPLPQLQQLQATITPAATASAHHNQTPPQLADQLDQQQQQQLQQLQLSAQSDNLLQVPTGLESIKRRQDSSSDLTPPQPQPLAPPTFDLSKAFQLITTSARSARVGAGAGRLSRRPTIA